MSDSAAPNTDEELAQERAEHAEEMRKLREAQERDTAMCLGFGRAVSKVAMQLREMIDAGYFKAYLSEEGSNGFAVLSHLCNDFDRVAFCGFFPSRNQAINHAVGMSNGPGMGPYTIVGVTADGVWIESVGRDYWEKESRRRAEEQNRQRRIRLAEIG